MAEIPQWAKQRVIELINAENAAAPASVWINWDIITPRVFAAYIAAHESEPVDPVLLEAREIVAAWYDVNPTKGYSSKYRDGFKDESGEVQQAITALKRGIELAKEQTP